MSNVKIKILWTDAIRIFPVRKGDTPVFEKEEKIAGSKMETVGILEQEQEEGFIVKNPVTIKLSTGEKHPIGDEGPSFYFIPKGMIESTQYL